VTLWTSLHPSVQVAIITGVFGLFGLLLERLRRDTKALHEDVRQTKYQVQNDHKTNLREDFDKMAGAVERVAGTVERIADTQSRHEELLRSHGTSLGSIRDDSRMERQERILLGQRVETVASELGELGRQVGLYHT